MNNNRLLGMILWAAGLVVPLLFLSLIPSEWNGTVWTVAVCTAVVYVGHLLLWLALQKGKLVFMNFPALTISAGSLVVQALWAIVVAFAAAAIPTKIATLVNVLLILGQVALLTMALSAKNTIQKTHSRQKDHHTEL